jgi:UDP-glucose 4-epimerase
MAAVVGVFRVLEDPIRVMAVNIAGCERVLRAAHSGNWSPQILIASTSEVYGTGIPSAGEGSPNCGSGGSNATPEFVETMEPMMGSSAVSRWNYSISKLADEAFGMSYARMHRLRVNVVRFFNTIGPRQRGRYGMVVPRFVRQAVRGEPITVFGDGSQSRCFCDVRDTVRALDVLTSNPASNAQIVNVGNAREVSILQLATLVREIACSKSEIRSVPYGEAYKEVFQETVRRKPDLTKFLSLTSFVHNWTLEETLGELIDIERARMAEESRTGQSERG